MSFGTESATPVGGQTLTGFIVSKAMQSRKEARKEDRKEKRKEKKEKQTKKENKQQQQKQGVGSKLLGSFPSLGNLFSAKKPPTKSAQQTQTRTSGGGTGLAKILTQGFGSLTADTMGVASGLASVTQLLNSSLKAQTFTATGVQTIASILSDQVENQGSILSTVKSLKPGGRTGGGGGGSGRGMFGSSKSSAIGGETLTGFVWGKIKDQVLAFLGGAVGGQLGKVKNLFKPKEAAAPKPAPSLSPKSTGRLTGSYDRFLQGKSNFGDRLRLLRKGQIGPGQMFTRGGVESLAKPPAGGGIGSMFNPKNFKLPNLSGLKDVKGGRGGLLGTAALLGAEIFKPQIQEASSKMWESLGVGPTAMSNEELQREYNHEKQKVERARAYRQQNPLLNMMGEPEGVLDSYNVLRGEMQKRKLNLASGGVMIGEAGKEAVVDLNSNHGKNVMGQQKGDPGMKASGAATLAVVDQFIKGMGPLGAPVSQALGPDIQNLARTFGMSQTLPNLKIGGGRFKEDGNAKKFRDDFLEELISGSLKALDAKKKDDIASEPGSTQTTKEQQQQSRPDNPDTGSATEVKTTSDGKPMDKHDPKSYGTGRQPVISGTEQGVSVTDNDKNRQTGQLEANHVSFKYNNKDYKVRINPNNGAYNVYETRGHLGLVDKEIDVGGPQGPKKGGVNEKLLQKAHNEVRAFYINNAPQTGLQFKYITQTDIENKNKEKARARVNGNQQKGGTVKSFDQGGRVQKPWWDFLGWATGAKEVKKGTTGIYSDSAMGRIGEAAAQRNKMMKELGYEKGGSMFGTESSNIDPMTDIRNRVKALEDIIAVTAITSARQPTAKPPAPRSAPRSAPVGATSETSSDVSSAAIINIVAGSGQTAPVQEATQSSQSTAEYASNPWPSGLAGVICTSPWSIV